MIGTFIFWQTSAKPEEERESIYRGEQKNFTETQPYATVYTLLTNKHVKKLYNP
jgi:hypothetical protein